jgi:hypothetical protein
MSDTEPGGCLCVDKDDTWIPEPETLNAAIVQPIELESTTQPVTETLNCKWEILEARMWGLIKKADKEHAISKELKEENKKLRRKLGEVAQEKFILEGVVIEQKDSITDLTLALMNCTNEVHVLEKMVGEIRKLSERN